MSIRWIRSVLDLGGDLRYAARGWRRTPGLSATIILTLALGLGLVAAIFSFADGYLFRPLPFPSADQLYRVSDPNARIASALLASDTIELRRSEIAGFGFVEWGISDRAYGALRIGDRRVEVSSYQISPRFRATLALPLIAGRDFSDADHRDSGVVPAWLGHRFWTREFGGDRGVLEQTFRLQDGPQSLDLRIVGILGPGFTSLDLNNPPPDVVVPQTGPPVVGPNRLSFPIVRLPDGMSREQAEARIAGVLQGVAPASDGRPRAVRLRPLRDSQLAGGRPTARVLFAGAMLVFLLASINLVLLMLTRGVSRAPEVATRVALGASGWRIARLFLTESLLFGAVGIAGGIAVGSWLSTLIEAQVPTYPTAGRNLALVPMIFDSRVVTFAAGLGLTVAFLAGCWPASRALRRPLGWTGRGAAGVAAASVSARLSRSILTSELAVATIVMMGTAFIGLGIWGYLHQPLGFDYVDRFRVSIAPADPQQVTSNAMAAALRAIRDVPGVKSAGAHGLETIPGVEVPGRAVDEAAVGASGVSAGYFEAWSLRLHAGRWFTGAEFGGDAPVAVVDRKLARLVWPDTDPIGQEIRIANGRLRHVVGVIEPQRRSLNRETSGQVLIPASQPPARGSLVVWAPQATAAEMRTRLATAVSSAVPGSDVRVDPVTLEMLFLRDVGEARFQAPIVVAFGVLAFALAGIGVLGLVSYLVEQRTREFGIRLALGARPADIWRGVIRQSIAPAILGLIIGISGAWALESVVRSSVFGWESSGAGAVSIVAAALFGVALAAAAWPACRAMRVDPAVALRME